MTNNQNQPNQYDAVLGGNAPPPIHGAVLGGIEGVKRRLASSNVEAQFAALNDALNCDKEGLNIVIKALEDNRRKVREAAVELLQDRNEPQAKLALENYKFWDGFEKLYGQPYGHSTTFANRKVIEFDPKTGITDTANTAYALRASYHYRSWRKEVSISIEEKLEKLQQRRQKRLAKNVKALVFGDSPNPEQAIFTALEKFINVKAIFIGDIQDEECMISMISLPCLSPILKASPQLEILKLRGRVDRYKEVFNPHLKHENLKAIIIESGGLSWEFITQLCQLELPALEYLELWLGRKSYGGNSSIEDLMPIISGKYPKLKYLGLRNSQYSDDIACTLADSPIIENLIELDLSMGTLSDKGAKALLDCSAVYQLDTLDISKNYLTDEMVKRFKQLDIEIIDMEEEQYYFDEGDFIDERYCTVGE
ncbi:MAG: HEAT repeat domain-containing protein [Rivularia sp. (in: cyanobacteria)]